MANTGYELTNPRIKRLKESVTSQTPGVGIERARYLTEADQENEALPIYIKRAKAVENILERMSIYIKDEELIAGNQASEQWTAPILPEYAVDWMEQELKEKGNFDKRSGDNFHLPRRGQGRTPGDHPVLEGQDSARQVLRHHARRSEEGLPSEGHSR